MFQELEYFLFLSRDSYINYDNIITNEFLIDS